MWMWLLLLQLMVEKKAMVVVVCLVARDKDQNEEVGVRIASKRYRRHDPSSTPTNLGMLVSENKE